MSVENRNKCKQYFITFPHRLGTKEQFARDMPPWDWCWCAEEGLDTDNPHFHCLVKLKHGISKSAYLTWIRTRFPNDYKRIDVQATRSLTDSISYTSKEDPKPFEEGVLERKKKKDPTEYVEETKKCLIDSAMTEHRNEWHKAFERKLTWDEFTRDFDKFLLTSGTKAEDHSIMEWYQEWLDSRLNGLDSPV